MPEDGLQFVQLQGRGHPEHAFAVKASVRDQDMAVGIEAEKVAEGLNGDDGAGDRIHFGNDLLHEDLQGFPGTTTQVMEKTAIIVFNHVPTAAVITGGNGNEKKILRTLLSPNTSHLIDAGYAEYQSILISRLHNYAR